jgi:hypothetical protein
MKRFSDAVVVLISVTIGVVVSLAVMVVISGLVQSFLGGY